MLPFERTLLRQLTHDTSFAERVMPYLKARYFTTEEGAHIFNVCSNFFGKYHGVPSTAAIRLGLDGIDRLGEAELTRVHEVLDTVMDEPLLESGQGPWLFETAESWVKERALYCGLQDAVKIMGDPKQEPGSIPTILREALAVSFDTHIGHDYFGDASARYEFYHKPEERLPFDLDTLNTLTGGGVPRKTLNVVMAGTNVGKSLALCHFAASYVASSKNVLYVTMEMAEPWIAHRIDANLFNLPLDDVILLSHDAYLRQVEKVRQTSTGRMLIKEYPTSSAHTGHFRTLLQECQLKQNFRPDVLIVDYLTICNSETVKRGGVNSFTFYKAVAEELRALSVETDLPVWTAAQFNRQGFQTTDPGLEHTGESFAIAQTADFCVALTTTEELDALGQINLTNLKNRYQRRSFVPHLLGLDTTRMKLYELSAHQKASGMAAAPANTVAPPVKPSVSAFSQRGRRSAPLSGLVKDNANNPALQQ